MVREGKNMAKENCQEFDVMIGIDMETDVGSLTCPRCPYRKLRPPVFREQKNEFER